MKHVRLAKQEAIVYLITTYELGDCPLLSYIMQYFNSEECNVYVIRPEEIKKISYRAMVESLVILTDVKSLILAKDIANYCLVALIINPYVEILKIKEKTKQKEIDNLSRMHISLSKAKDIVVFNDDVRIALQQYHTKCIRKNTLPPVKVKEITTSSESIKLTISDAISDIKHSVVGTELLKQLKCFNLKRNDTQILVHVFIGASDNAPGDRIIDWIESGIPVLQIFFDETSFTSETMLPSYAIGYFNMKENDKKIKTVMNVLEIICNVRSEERKFLLKHQKNYIDSLHFPFLD